MIDFRKCEKFLQVIVITMYTELVKSVFKSWALLSAFPGKGFSLSYTCRLVKMQMLMK